MRKLLLLRSLSFSPRVRSPNDTIHISKQHKKSTCSFHCCLNRCLNEDLSYRLKKKKKRIIIEKDATTKGSTRKYYRHFYTIFADRISAAVCQLTKPQSGHRNSPEFTRITFTFIYYFGFPWTIRNIVNIPMFSTKMWSVNKYWQYRIDDTYWFVF